MLRRGHDLLGRADLEDATEVHDRHPVGDVPRQAEVMGDDDQRQTQFVAQPQQQGEDLPANRRVEARHRLVGDDDLRVEDERSRDHHPLALPAGQFVWVAQVEALGWTQSRTRECVGHLGLLALVQAVYPQALGYRLVHGVPRVERSGRVLQDQLRPPAVGLQSAGPVRQRLACDVDRARRRSLQTENCAGQCRFPGAAFADQSDDLAAADGEVDAVDRARHPTTPDTELDSRARAFRAPSRRLPMFAVTRAPPLRDGRRRPDRRSAPAPAPMSCTRQSPSGNAGETDNPQAGHRGMADHRAHRPVRSGTVASPIRGNAAASARA